jgi:hypothetical protein
MEANNFLVDNYYNLLQNLNPDSKVELIKRLLDSIRKEVRPEHDRDPLFGALDMEESAEDMIKRIKDSEIFDRDIEGF